MTPLYANAPQLAKPMPRHTLTESAEAARVAIRERHEHEAPRELPLVTVPPFWRREPLEALTGAPAAFAKAALEAGHEVAARRAGDVVQVAVRSPRIRVTWKAGKVSGSATLGLGALVEGKVATLAQARAALT